MSQDRRTGEPHTSLLGKNQPAAGATARDFTYVSGNEKWGGGGLGEQEVGPAPSPVGSKSSERFFPVSNLELLDKLNHGV